MATVLGSDRVQRQPRPLHSGDRLTRAEFERRYHAMPITRAELIESVVYLSSPVSLKHAQSHAQIVGGWAFIVQRRGA